MNVLLEKLAQARVAELAEALAGKPARGPCSACGCAIFWISESQITPVCANCNPETAGSSLRRLLVIGKDAFRWADFDREKELHEGQR